MPAWAETQFRAELLAPSVAWLQLERRVQELEAAAAEQGARQSRQGRVVHELRGKVQEVDGRVQELHGNVRWPPEDSQHPAEEDVDMGPTLAAEELFLALPRDGDALAAAGLTDDGSTLSELFLDKRRAARGQLSGGGGGCWPHPLLSPALAPRAAPQAPTSPWQDAVPPWKTPPWQFPPASLRDMPPPPPPGPVPLGQPGPSPPPPPGQPVLEKAPPKKAPPPPLPADALQAPPEPYWQARARAQETPANPDRVGPPAADLEQRWTRVARLDYLGQVLRQGWLRSIHTSGCGLPTRVPATHVNEVEEETESFMGVAARASPR